MGSVHGCVFGVFDVFHVGHLQVLQAAAERCDYLTVAVANDQLVSERKGRAPVVSLSDRMEIVQSMRMVDNVTVLLSLDPVEVQRLLHLHVIFAPETWHDNERWIATERSLTSVGVRLERLPYTQTTSSEALMKADLARSA